MAQKKPKNTETRISKAARILTLVAVVGILFGFIKVQLIDGDMWRRFEKRRNEEIQIDPAKRGTIFSSNGRVLVENVPVCDVYLDLGWSYERNGDGSIAVNKKTGDTLITQPINDSLFEKHLPEVCRILHKANDGKKDSNYWRGVLVAERNKEKPSRCLLLMHRMPRSLWLQLREIPGWKRGVVQFHDHKSVVMQYRSRIANDVALNVIGIRHGDDNKYSGLEGKYNKQLRGQDGEYFCRRLTKDDWIPTENDKVPTKSRIDGIDIISTIDTRFQGIAESALRQALMRHGATAGCAVLMEVKTGYVLACANLVQDTTGGRLRYKERLDRNIACSDVYQPGSTFKTVILTALLNDPNIDLDSNTRVKIATQQFDPKYPETTIPKVHTSLPDYVSLKQVLAYSENAGMCHLAWKYYHNNREELLKSVMDIFCYEPLNLDLTVSEPRTHVPNMKSEVDFLRFCYGYGTNMTPMQMLTFYNAIANNGKMVKPLFCRALKYPNHTKVIKPVVLKQQICSHESVIQLRAMLRSVVDSGTASNIRQSSYSIAGKTGTAIRHNDKEQLHNNSSFVGFFPANNPQYSCYVMVTNVKTAGSTAAAPVFERIANSVSSLDPDITHRPLPKAKNPTSESSRIAKGRQRTIAAAYESVGMKYKSTIDDASLVRYDKEKKKYVPYTLPDVMPDCYGLTVRDALDLLESMGMKVYYTGYGHVTDQEPRAFSKIRQGQQVKLTLSN